MNTSGSYEERIRRAVEDADTDFWITITEHFPEIKSGDETPMENVTRIKMLTDMVNKWYNDNSYSIGE
jgi:hypothetical protein